MAEKNSEKALQKREAKLKRDTERAAKKELRKKRNSLWRQKDENIRWEKLDNTANVFPVIAGESLTNTYRISCTLKEEVNPIMLQMAVDIVTPKFPSFNLRLRAGVFWYYFEENGKMAPRVEEETTYPCRLIHTAKNSSYLFRVTYYKTRINLEAFHALADGMGGIGFLRELTYQYLRLMHSELGRKLSDELSEETSLDREDSFKANFKKSQKGVYKSGKAYIFRGEKLPYDGFGVMHGFMPVSELKKAAKGKYGASINEYLIAAFVYGAYQAKGRGMSEKRPLRVAVPVNLRPFFSSITTKNFFAMVSAEFAPDASHGEYTFAEIVAIVRESLREQITKENLEAVFSYNLGFEQRLAARMVPLPLKNFAIRLVYEKNAAANSTTITNIGNVTVQEEYRDYIENFFCFLPFSKGQYLKATITSYGDTLVYSYTSAFSDTAIQRNVFRQIASDGVPVQLETNGVYDV